MGKDVVDAYIEQCRMDYNSAMEQIGLPTLNVERWHQILSEPLEDTKRAFAMYRAHGPNGRKTIFTDGPVGWIDAGPVGG